MISHNLRFIRETTDALAVMYAGKLVEIGKTKAVMAHPAHPFTQVLLSANENKINPALWNSTPVLFSQRNGDLTPGCSFQAICPEAMAVCKRECPTVQDMGNGHRFWCHL